MKLTHTEAAQCDATVSVLVGLSMPYAQALVTAAESLEVEQISGLSEKDRNPDPRNRREMLRSKFAGE